MSKQSLIIYKIPVLYNILSEIGENFEFSLYNFNEKNDFQKIDNKKYGNYIILTDLKNKITNKSNQLVFENKLSHWLNSHLLLIERNKHNTSYNFREHAAEHILLFDNL